MYFCESEQKNLFEMLYVLEIFRWKNRKYGHSRNIYI
jgi:hypothetical protein